MGLLLILSSRGTRTSSSSSAGSLLLHQQFILLLDDSEQKVVEDERHKPIVLEQLDKILFDEHVEDLVHEPFFEEVRIVTRIFNVRQKNFKISPVVELETDNN